MDILRCMDEVSAIFNSSLSALGRPRKPCFVLKDREATQTRWVNQVPVAERDVGLY